MILEKQKNGKTTTNNLHYFAILISLALSLLLLTLVMLGAFQLTIKGLIDTLHVKTLLNSVKATIIQLVNELNKYFWVYFPLGIIGIWRWTTWSIKKICASRYTPISSPEIPGYHTTMAVVTPVYDEKPELFRQALKSWDANSPDEIIAVIDWKDTNCINIFKEFSRNKAYAKLIITTKPGKRRALADGIIQAKSQIVALVDSDVVWAPDIRKILLAPFKEPKIGGVTTSQYAAGETKSVLQKIADMLWSQRNHLEWPSQVAMGKVVMCLSGRTSLYRRHILLPKLDYFLNEIILGRKKESGDDKCLTRIIQKDGWNTYFQKNARVFTETPSDFKTYWHQKVRWTRNSFNSDLMSMWEGWIWHHPFLAFATVDRFISVFTLFIGPIAFGFALLENQWILAMSILALWLVGRGIKLYPYLRINRHDLIVVPVYVAMNFTLGAARIYALFTIRRQKWIRAENRQEEKYTKLPNFNS